MLARRGRAAAVPWAGEQKNSRFEARRVMNRSRLHVFYSGTVQGVGFRYTVRTLASGFELTGTVRNLPDGRVELLAEGLKHELGAFQQAIRESELGHFIQREDVTWAEPAGGLRGFEIVS
jgi:acylphosphatase